MDEPKIETRGTEPIGPGRRWITAKGWIISILVAILLSVAATWFLGNMFRQKMAHAVDSSTSDGASSSGCRMKCCPP
jgi:hypothetical protein